MNRLLYREDCGLPVECRARLLQPELRTASITVSVEGEEMLEVGINLKNQIR